MRYPNITLPMNKQSIKDCEDLTILKEDLKNRLEWEDLFLESSSDNIRLLKRRIAKLTKQELLKRVTK